MNFIDRTTYLQAVQKWKEDYKLLSASIRSSKNQVRERQRELHINLPDREFFTVVWDINRLLQNTAELSKQATAMLKVRTEAKKVAQEQYLQNQGR